MQREPDFGFLSREDDPGSRTKEMRLEGSERFSPYASFVQLMGANPAMDGLSILSCQVERRTLEGEGRDYVSLRLICTGRERPPREVDNALIHLALFRYREDLSLEEFRGRLERARREDFEKIYSDVHLLTLRSEPDHCEPTGDGYVYPLTGSLSFKALERITDGVYLVSVDVGGARMTRDAKWGTYRFGGGQVGAKPVDGPRAAHPDDREYKNSVVDLERYVSYGADPAILQMRCEGYAVTVEPLSIRFRVYVNSKVPLTVGSVLPVFYGCNVTFTQGSGRWKKWKDVINDWSNVKNTIVLKREDYPYDDAYGYILEMIYGEEELRIAPQPGLYQVRFCVDMAQYLRSNGGSGMIVEFPVHPEEV